MALIVKGVFEITCSVINAVVHVILRDLTNYYWYLDEAERQNNDTEEGLILNSSDEGCVCLGSSNENERTEFVNTGEFEGGNIPYESFCTSLNIEDSVPNAVDEMHSIEDNTIVQNYEENNSLEAPEQESSNNIPDVLDKIDIEDNTEMENDEEKLNSLRSPKKENIIWVEIENTQQSFEDRNLDQDYLNITEKERSGNISDYLAEKSEPMLNIQTENLDLGSEVEEKSNPSLDDNNLSESIETECSLNNDNETGENLFTCETIEKEQILKNCDDSSENMFIGDSKKSEIELKNDGKSDISSECELGIRNFQIQNLIDGCSNVGKPGSPIQKKKKKPMKSKISRYVGNTALPKNNKVEESKTLDKPSIAEPKLIMEETEKVDLHPVKYDEITNTQSLLNELQNLTDSESNVEPTKFTELQDDLSEISRVPAEMSDLGSVCSDDSWDSWLGKFTSIMRAKSPVKSPEVSFVETPNAAEQDEAKEDLCNCVNSHCCLLVVDSDDEGTSSLLSPEQLGSVETGSVSDWLYRVNPPNPLLPSTNETEMRIAVEQEQNTNLYSESSEEDIAKKFFIQQWLYDTENYYTDLSSKLIGSGDIM